MKNRIDRRTFLRGTLYGAATTIALPMLEMFLDTNGEAHADGTSLPPRFVLLYWGNGTRISQWLPSTTGPGYALSPVLAPYAPVKDYVSVVTGLKCGIGGIVHHWGIAGMLSAAPYQSSGTGTVTTLSQPTFDQVVAAQIGTTTRFKSLELGVMSPTKSDEGTTLQYLSHNGPNSVNPAQCSPAELFKRLYGQNALSTSYGSVLDTVLSDITSLQQRLSATDRQRMDEFATQVRQIESSLQSKSGLDCAALTDPGIDSASVNTVAALTKRSQDMWSLMCTALSCDLTRVISVQYCGPSDCIQVPPEVFSGVSLYEGGGKPLANDVTHGMTHNESSFDQPVVTKWSTFFQAQFSDLLVKMKATADGSGNLLDHAAVMITSELSQGRNHSNLHMPMVLAGRANGKLVYPGIHLAANATGAAQVSGPTPANTYDASGDITTNGANFVNATDAHMTVLRALGISQASYGQAGAASTTPLSPLLT